MQELCQTVRLFIIAKLLIVEISGYKEMKEDYPEKYIKPTGIVALSAFTCQIYS